MEEKKNLTVGEQISVIVGLAHFYCWGVFPWLRKGWGASFAGLPAVISTLFAMPFTIAGVDGNDRAAKCMLISTLFMCFMRRMQCLEQPSAGSSFYSGFSIFKGDAWTAKGVKEPLLLLVLAFVASPFSRGLAVYLGVSAICLAITVAYGRAALNAKARLIEDARIEQESVMRHYQETYGNDQ